MSSSINSVVSLDHRQNVAVVIIDSPPVNALSQPVREGVSLALRQALGDPDVRAVVLHCAGRTFCAGADISEFGRPLSAPDLNQVFENHGGRLRPHRRRIARHGLGRRA
nr:enoyl-CoA hydratase/isomerase family protein [uncultured Brevundimonas sp.]